MARHATARLARRVALGLAALIGLALLTFALPVPGWRTGEGDMMDIEAILARPAELGTPAGGTPMRIWIDTDAACGAGPTTDPDDCLAILLLARATGLRIAGISTVFGNAPLATADATMRALAAELAAEGAALPAVHRGAAAPGDASGTAAPAALRTALEEGPLTILALGPLTNIAAALAGRPALQDRVTRLVAVMGRRENHLFHPAEGGSGGVLFGHGPVFSDFNVAQDPAAVAAVVGMALPMVLVPYEAARAIELTAADLDRLDRRGGAAAWAAARVAGWLDHWRKDIGRAGFYPFDLLAAAQIVAPNRFRCGIAAVWVGRNRQIFGLFGGRAALLVRPEGAAIPDDAQAAARAAYCAEPAPGLHDWLIVRLAGPERGGAAAESD